MTPAGAAAGRGRISRAAACSSTSPTASTAWPGRSTKPGRDFELSPSLKPLAKHRDDFTVFSGLHHPNGLGQAHVCADTWLDRRQDRRPERPQVREHHLLRPGDGRTCRPADALPVAGAVHQLGHRAAAATRPRWPSPAMAYRCRPRTTRGIVFNRLFGDEPGGVAAQRRGSPSGAACSMPSSTTPRRSAAASATTTAPSSTNTCTPSATLSSGPSPARLLARRAQAEARQGPGRPVPARRVPAKAGEYWRTMFDLIVLALRTDMTRVVTT